MQPQGILRLPRTEFEAPDAFSRLDESDDAAFYAAERLVYHMDARARQTVERVIGTLCVEPEPAILDLMAGWKSHIPEAVRPAQVVPEVTLRSAVQVDHGAGRGLRVDRLLVVGLAEGLG